MNPDVFITIAFVGIAVLVVLVPLVLYVPRMRREAALVKTRESSRPPQTAAGSPSARRSVRALHRRPS